MIHVGIAEYIGSVVQGLAYSEAPEGNIFIDDLPTDPEVAVGVYLRPGTEPDSKLPYDPRGVQVLVRGTSDPRVALTLAEAIYSELLALRNLTLPDGTYLVYALAEQPPFRMDSDVNGRAIYCLNLQTEIKNPTQFRT